MLSKFYVRAGCLASLSLLVSQAFAQDVSPAPEQEKEWSVFLGAGGFYSPEYLGSKDYQLSPVLIGTIQKDHYYLKFTGTQLEANVLPFDSFYAGPVIGYGFGRKDVSDSVVKKLPEVDEELWVGGAAGVGYNGLMLQRDSIGARIEVVHDLMGDSGTTATFSVGYEVNATQRLAFGVDVSTTYVDKGYADAYYSVTANGASASGLAQYQADAGFRDVTVDFSSRYAFTESWGVGGIAGGSLVVGEAADSPIVKERGQDLSGHGGLFLWYRF